MWEWPARLPGRTRAFLLAQQPRRCGPAAGWVRLDSCGRSKKPSSTTVRSSPVSPWGVLFHGFPPHPPSSLCRRPLCQQKLCRYCRRPVAKGREAMSICSASGNLVYVSHALKHEVCVSACAVFFFVCFFLFISLLVVLSRVWIMTLLIRSCNVFLTWVVIPLAPDLGGGQILLVDLSSNASKMTAGTGLPGYRVRTWTLSIRLSPPPSCPQGSAWSSCLVTYCSKWTTHLPPPFCNHFQDGPIDVAQFRCPRGIVLDREGCLCTLHLLHCS